MWHWCSEVSVFTSRSMLQLFWGHNIVFCNELCENECLSLLVPLVFIRYAFWVLPSCAIIPSFQRITNSQICSKAVQIVKIRKILLQMNLHSFLMCSEGFAELKVLHTAKKKHKIWLVSTSGGKATDCPESVHWLSKILHALHVNCIQENNTKMSLKNTSKE